MIEDEDCKKYNKCLYDNSEKGLKEFNEQLYNNSDINKCNRCASVLTEGNWYYIRYEFKDKDLGIDIDKTEKFCRHCIEKANALLMGEYYNE